MPLFGTLKTMPLPDLLQWLAGARKTGTLQVERNRVHKWILLKGGQVVGCSSDDPPERLGQFLLSRGKITEEQLRIALAAQDGSDKYLGRIFIEMGALTPEDLSAHLEAKAEETIYSVFDWDDATFRFHEELTENEAIFQVDLRVEDVLLRGMKRYDDLQRIREVLHDRGMVLAHTPRRPPQEVFQNNMARSLYEAIDGERTVAEILLHVHGSEYLVTKFLFELLRNGFLEIKTIKELPPALRSTLQSEIMPLHDQPTDGTAVAVAAGPVPITPDGATAVATAAAPLIESTADPLTDAGVAAIDGPPMAAEPASAAAEPLAAAEPMVDPDVAPGLDMPDVFTEPTELEAVEQSESYQMEKRLSHARRLMQETEFDQALVILDELYQKAPQNDSLRRLTAEAEAAFIEKAYKHYVPLDKIPVLVADTRQLESEALSPGEFFLLSRLDGTWDVRSVIQIAPIREVEALLTLKRLRERGLIDLRDPGAGS